MVTLNDAVLSAVLMVSISALMIVCVPLCVVDLLIRCYRYASACFCTGGGSPSVVFVADFTFAPVQRCSHGYNNKILQKRMLDGLDTLHVYLYDYYLAKDHSATLVPAQMSVFLFQLAMLSASSRYSEVANSLNTLRESDVGCLL